MRKRKLYAVVVLLFVISNLQFAQDNNIKSIINKSIELSPKIKMLKAKRDIAFYRIDQKSNLPDPMLTLALINLPTNSFSFDQEAMTGKIIGLTQKFPFPGKLSAMEDFMAIDTLIIDQEINDEINKITETVTKSYFDLSYFRQAIFYAEETAKLLKEIEDVVGVKYSVSTATQQNLIKVQLEITKISDKIEELKSMEKNSLSIINSFLFKEASNNINTVIVSSIKPVNIKLEELTNLAEKNRPFLKGIKYSVEKAQLSKSIADKDYYPDISLGVQYSLRERIASTGKDLDNMMSLVLGISIPINYGGKLTAKVEESVSLQKLNEEKYSTALQFLISKFGSDLAELKSTEERIKLFEEGLLPQVNQNLKSALASYQVDEVDFINVIDAQDQLFKIETNLYKLKTNYLKQIAELEFLTGTSLTN
ncbi:MAG: hypothetical protein CO128_02370 [Ignavibacteriales bacterium CG_4_9_14_3_um_filter_30_11]|nr:MAG: hypothetical protein CO128_02370 [Ignavibacteriales bacterium CG_4_9_14_3_um_filter_30_11]